MKKETIDLRKDEEEFETSILRKVGLTFGGNSLIDAM